MFHAAVRPAVIAAIALFPVLAGCGGVEREPNLAKAAERTEATGSSRIEARGLDAQNGEEFNCEGVADYAWKRLQISCAYGGEGVASEMLALEGALYFKDELSSGKWQKSPTTLRALSAASRQRSCSRCCAAPAARPNV